MIDNEQPLLPKRGMFRDRRSGIDRRFRDSAIRDQGRREKIERRRVAGQFSPTPWWLKVDYVTSEINAPRDD
jgi:hypothetical protein